MSKSISFTPLNTPMYNAVIANLEEHRELYEEVATKAKEEFGARHRASKMILNGIDVKNCKGSQFFWNTYLNQFLPKGQGVMTLSDLEAIFSTDRSFFRGFYTDMTSVVLRSDEDVESNQYILKNLTGQLQREGFTYSPENPALISGLKLVKDKNTRNKSGLLLEIGENTEIVNDSRFASGNNKIQLGNSEIDLYTKSKGLSRLCLLGVSYLFSCWDYLAFSFPDGRVVVVDSTGVAPEFF